jgi:hypothetical protein
MQLRCRAVSHFYIFVLLLGPKVPVDSAGIIPGLRKSPLSYLKSQQQSDKAQLRGGWRALID